MKRQLGEGYELDDDVERVDVHAVHDYLANHSYWAEGRPRDTVLRLVREAASLAALCEVAEESAGGGHLPELRARLAELRETEGPVGIEEAEAEAAALAETLQPEPRVASGAYLDAIGSASRRLEQALGEGGPSPFAAAMQAALGSVEAVADDVERNHKLPLT